MTTSSAHWSASDCPGDLPPPTLIESVGHGIRQPLMAINLYGAALREQLVATPALATVKQIQQAGASLQNLFEDLLLVSQFTLAADTGKGMRPSFTSAATPEAGRRWFERLVQLAIIAHAPVEIGRFGTHMSVALVNDGPVTFWLEAP